MWQHFVYLHRKASSGEPFYVGKGKLHKDTFERAFAHANRNIIWQRTVKKYGLTVEIIASCLNDIAAQEIERLKIKEIGRRDLGLGPLVNLTDGGEGHAGIIASEELRRKRSINSRGKRSPAWVAAIRKARKNGGNGGVVKYGDKLPESWRENIAKTKIGARNPMYGKTGELHPKSKKVLNIDTGKIYPSITAAAKSIGEDMKQLHAKLKGYRNRINDTPMELL